MSIRKFRIVDTTLREGEQFALTHFTSEQKIAIARALDAFGVDYIELTSPMASPQSLADLRTITALPLGATVLTHTRCRLEDVQLAIEAGAQGVNVLYPTSSILKEASHNRTVDQIIAGAQEVISYVQDAGREIRFSTEDSFRTDPEELVRIYSAVDELRPNRVGIADTVGIATPNQVHELVSRIRSAVNCDIEFHAHNDTDCATANAYAALEAGATHIDATVLGIGERNGIVSLSGLMARLLTTTPELLENYQLELLPELDGLVAEIIGLAIPFNAPITAPTAFHHKAGMHAKAMLHDTNSYEIMDPALFGRERKVLWGHRLTGRHAVGHRADSLGLQFADDILHEITREIKQRSDARPMTDTELDDLLHKRATA